MLAVSHMLRFAILFIYIVIVFHRGVESSRIKAIRPKAYIHIGSKKTGSTDIQANLNDNIDALQKWNMCHPNFDYRNDQGAFQSKLENELLGHENTTDFKHFLSKSAASGCNVIISAEILQDIGAAKPATPGNNTALSTLKKWLDPFDVAIVVFYRDVLARLLSFYNMKMNWQTTWFLGNVLPNNIAVFLEEHFATERIMTLIHMTMDYINEFGSDSVIIVDYDGVKAAGLDGSYVLQCEIMGVRCEETAKLNGGAHCGNLNSKPSSIIVRQLFNVAESYTREISPDCGFANVAGEFSSQRTELLHIIQRHIHHLPHNRHVPTINVDLRRFKKLSLFVDAELRANPAIKRWYYANATASAEARAALVHEDIDVYTLFSDHGWRSWWEKLLTRLNLTRFCKHSCRPPPSIGEQRSRVPLPCEED